MPEVILQNEKKNRQSRKDTKREHMNSQLLKQKKGEKHGINQHTSHK